MMSDNSMLVLKGNIVFTKTDQSLTALENSYIVCKDGIIVDVFQVLPECYNGAEIKDYGDNIIIPGLVDLHLHAPQFAIRGMGMDLELIPWLNKYAFTEESKYQDEVYATAAYSAFCKAMLTSPTTRASIYATLHSKATRILMDMMEKTGLVTYVGKVNMDRNCPAHLIEKTDESVTDTEEWINQSLNAFTNTKPIITPRFVPSCSGELMESLGRLAVRYHVPVQSHLSENTYEVKWVRELHPDEKTYSDVYHRFGLFGDIPTIMAHCIHLSDREMDMIKDKGVYVAHCPQSNTNLASGIAPVRRMLKKGIRVGLGTDIAGGFSISMFRTISDAIQMSKMYSALIDAQQPALTFTEAFYLATKGGGSFFGQVGSFEPGYEMDALVIDDSDINGLSPLTLAQRLERIVHLSEDRHIKRKYVRGVAVI
jgi:guanine deaminase